MFHSQYWEGILRQILYRKKEIENNSLLQESNFELSNFKFLKPNPDK